VTKYRLIVLVTFLGGLYFFFRFFLPPHYGGDYLISKQTWVSQVLNVMGAVAVGLGVINIGMVYGRRVVRKEKEWPESLALLIAFVTTLVFGFGDMVYRDQNTIWNAVYEDIIFSGIFVSLGAAMFSLLAFYITQAAFRAFRIKSTEAALIMASALLIMLGALPIPLLEDVIPVWLGEFRTWILTGVNVGVQRAVLLGAGTAGLIMAVRMWFSLDRSAFGGRGGGT